MSPLHSYFRVRFQMTFLNLSPALASVVLLSFLFGSSVSLPAQVPVNVFARVRLLKAGTKSGTSFTVDVDGRQYLVTAKHVVAELSADDTIQVRRDEEWQSVKVRVMRCDDPIDIAVLIPERTLTPSFPLSTVDNHYPGQDVYFSGFPFGLAGGFFSSGKGVNDLYPVAFTKKAILSAFKRESGFTILFLDGHNNPGFSGGPIVYKNLDAAGNVFHLLGVISGYQPEWSPVMIAANPQPNSKEKEVIAVVDGRKVAMNKTDYYTQRNTGIIVGYSIKHAVDLIRKNPIGPLVGTQ